MLLTIKVITVAKVEVGTVTVVVAAKVELVLTAVVTATSAVVARTVEMVVSQERHMKIRQYLTFLGNYHSCSFI